MSQAEKHTRMMVQHATMSVGAPTSTASLLAQLTALNNTHNSSFVPLEAPPSLPQSRESSGISAGSSLNPALRSLLQSAVPNLTGTAQGGAPASDAVSPLGTGMATNLPALATMPMLSALRAPSTTSATISHTPAAHGNVSGQTSPVSATQLQQLLCHLQAQEQSRQVESAAQQQAQQQAQQLQQQAQQLQAQQQLVQQLAQALVASHASQAQLMRQQSPPPRSQRGSTSPVPGASMSPVQAAGWSANNSARQSPVPMFRQSPVPQPSGMTINGERVSAEQFLRIYALRSKQTCSGGPMDQAAAGRSMVVAGIFHLPPKTIRDIWARKIGAEWTNAGWTERERHLHACEGVKTPEEESRENAGKKRKASPTIKTSSAESQPVSACNKSRKMESDL
jgi:hypothetical protein